jgi:Na+-driven multidrug efflux pump
MVVRRTAPRRAGQRAALGYVPACTPGATRAVAPNSGRQIVVSACVLGSAYTAAMVLALPLAYVWLAEAVGWALCLVMAWGWLRGGYWRRLDV